MLKKISSGPFITFYVVFAYVIVFALWWAYLLYAKNETAYFEKIQLNAINFHKSNPSRDYTSTDEYVKIHSKYFRQKIMIVAEGSAFLVLLVFGLWRVRKVFLHEMYLADQQRNFLLSITHELRSPLASIKISMQTLSKRKLEAEQTEKLIANSLTDLDRLEALVDNILFAAKIERNEHGFVNDEIDISEITIHAVQQFSQNKKSITIRPMVRPNVYFYTDAIGFTSVVNNLLENAIKYSEPQTEIVVTLEDTTAHVILSVADHGIGIPADERQKIFEKFYRIGHENTRKTKGTGLGLYIIKRFVEIYNGKISIENNQPSGSIFELSFPKPKG